MSETSMLIHDLDAAVSPVGPGPLRGAALGELRMQAPASIAIAGERIVAVGPPAEVLRDHPPGSDCRTIDGWGKTALPGLVDCHTHACYLGDRAREFELRARGAGYEELHAAGGGILSTVAAVRAGSEDELTAATRQHLEWMLEHGTTTAEVKSGYGLDRDNELKMLCAIRRAADDSPLDVSQTFLGAHATPPEFASPDAYVDYLISEVLPDATRHADAADIFLERGAFDAATARRYLAACRAAGLALRLHGDQFSEQGAIPLAIELGSRSVDHLEATGEDGARTLAHSDVAAVILPACALFLGLPAPPARTLIEEGGIVALATDFNPGSAFCESLPLAMNLACTRLKLSPAEALAAGTVNAAHVLGLADRGRLAPGCLADLLLLDAPDWRWLAYHLGGDRFAAKIKRGRLVA
jgi:imidazolonepropionase